MLNIFSFGFILTAPGPAKCYKCLENDADTCTLQQDTQTCRDDSYSLGETHCGSATIKFRDVLSGSINVSVIRGCINCAGGPVIGVIERNVERDRERESGKKGQEVYWRREKRGGGKQDY